MIKTITYTLLSRAGLAISALLSLIISSRFLGAEVVGQWSLLLLHIAIIHAIAEVFTGSGLVYFIPRVNTAGLYQKGLLWLLCISLLSVVVIFFTVEMLRPYIWHLLFLALLGALHNYHLFLLLGKEQLKLYNTLILVQPLSNLITLLVAVFVLNWRGIEASIAALYVSYVLSLALGIKTIMRLVHTVTSSDPPQTTQILARGFVNQLGNLAHMLSNRFNYYILALGSISVVGVYSSGTSLIESVWTVSAALSPIVLSRVANSKNASEEAGTSLRLATYSLLLSVLLVLIVLMVPSELFTMLLGKDFSQVKEIMLYLSPGVLALSFSSVLSHYFSGRGMQRVLLLANASGLLVTIALSNLLIKNFGVLGACMTAGLAYGMQCLVISVVFFRERDKL